MRISIVIVNLNGAQWLSISLPSLREQTIQPSEILVADNGSSDDSQSVAQSYGARFFALGSNHGFAGANNIAAQNASGDVVVFLNNDMYFAPTFLEELIQPLSDPAVFAVDAQQFTFDGKVSHSATRLCVQGWKQCFTSRGLFSIGIEQYVPSGTTSVVQACAANMAVKKETFLRLGGFDDRLPAGWEDTDICWRAALRGLRTVYVPTAMCWHKIGASSEAEPGRSVRYRGDVGGPLLVATKLLPFEITVLAWGSAVLGVIADAVSGQWRNSKRRMSVLREFGRFIPALVRERYQIHATARRTPRQQLSLLLKIGNQRGNLAQACD